MRRESQRRLGPFGCLCDGHALVLLPMCLAVFALSLQVTLTALPGQPSLAKACTRSHPHRCLSTYNRHLLPTHGFRRLPFPWTSGASGLFLGYCSGQCPACTLSATAINRGHGPMGYQILCAFARLCSKKDYPLSETPSAL